MQAEEEYLGRIGRMFVTEVGPNSGPGESELGPAEDGLGPGGARSDLSGAGSGPDATTARALRMIGHLTVKFSWTTHGYSYIALPLLGIADTAAMITRHRRLCLSIICHLVICLIATSHTHTRVALNDVCC